MIQRLQEPVSFPKDNSEWHRCLEGDIEDALTIREHIESLPDTSATFRLKNIRDGLNKQHAHIQSGVMKLMGSWEVPKELSNNDGRVFVNPSYQHSQHYSDALVTCECGIPVLRESFGPDEKQPAHHQEHKDDCTKINRLDAQKRLLENRRDIIRDGYNHNQSLNSMAQRLGYSSERPLSKGNVRDLGVDIDRLKRLKREKLARTLMVLSREYGPSTLGELFDVDRRTISQMLNKETKSHSKTMYSIRRATVYADD